MNDYQNSIMNEFPEFFISNTMILIKTNNHEVVELIQELNLNSSPGYDNITTNDIMTLKSLFVPILVLLINKAFLEEKFPDELKIGKASAF